MPEKQETKPVRVKVVAFDMPFFSMVGFMVKWVIASIPAFIILAIAGLVTFAAFVAFTGGI